MNSQTENYIALKPIAERFNEIAKNMTDSEIKHVIVSVLEKQARSFCESYFENFMEDLFDNDKFADEARNAIIRTLTGRLK